MQQEAINEFKVQLRGELIEPTDTRYEDSSTTLHWEAF